MSDTKTLSGTCPECGAASPYLTDDGRSRCKNCGWEAQGNERRYDEASEFFAPCRGQHLNCAPCGRIVLDEAEFGGDERLASAHDDDDDDDDLGPDEDEVDERQIAVALNEALHDALDDADAEDVTGTPYHGLTEAHVSDLADGGWMTTDHGVEIRLPDGATFLVTVKYAGRR